MTAITELQEIYRQAAKDALIELAREKKISVEEIRKLSEEKR